MKNPLRQSQFSPPGACVLFVPGTGVAAGAAEADDRAGDWGGAGRPGAGPVRPAGDASGIRREALRRPRPHPGGWWLRWCASSGSACRARFVRSREPRVPKEGIQPSVCPRTRGVQENGERNVDAMGRTPSETRPQHLKCSATAEILDRNALRMSQLTV